MKINRNIISLILSAFIAISSFHGINVNCEQPFDINVEQFYKFPTKLRTVKIGGSDYTYENDVITSDSVAKIKFVMNQNFTNLKVKLDGEPVEVEFYFESGKKIGVIDVKYAGRATLRTYQLSVTSFDPLADSAASSSSNKLPAKSINKTVELVGPPLLLRNSVDSSSSSSLKSDASGGYRVKRDAAFELNCSAVVGAASRNQIVNESWYFVQRLGSASVRRVLPRGAPAASRTLQFEAVATEDAGLYECRVSNAFGGVSHHMWLRVRDPLAPVWPLIGIVLQALLLAAIILGFELRNKRRRHAADASKQMTQQQQQQQQQEEQQQQQQEQQPDQSTNKNTIATPPPIGSNNSAANKNEADQQQSEPLMQRVDEAQQLQEAPKAARRHPTEIAV